MLKRERESENEEKMDKADAGINYLKEIFAERKNRKNV